MLVNLISCYIANILLHNRNRFGYLSFFLERFVVYRSCEQIISAAPPGAAQRARGIAQAFTRHRPISKLKLKVETQTRGDGRSKP